MNENKMSKNLEVLKADVKKLMLKDWTETEVTKLDEFMEDVIIATMVVNKLPIHVVVGRSEQLVCYLCDEDGWIRENKGDIIEHRLCKCDKAN